MDITPKIKIIISVRIMLTMILIYLIYEETGFFTALFAFIISLFTEMTNTSIAAMKSLNDNNESKLRVWGIFSHCD